MVGSHAERILAAKLREGLWDAVLESDIVDPGDIDSIRFQKLLLKGIEHFDLRDRLTVEWYLDGEIVSSDEADRDKVGEQTGLSSAHEFHLQENPTVGQITQFYSDKLDEKFLESTSDGTFRFLRTYYGEHDDIPYQELYLRNLDVDQNLSRIETKIANGGDVSNEDIHEFEAVCRDLKSELLLYKEFRQVHPYVDTFEAGGVRLLEQLAAGKSIEDINKEGLISEYDQFYYYSLWRIVAQIVSYHNHSGPSGPEVAEMRKQELRDTDEMFLENYEGLAGWMEQRNITLPNPSNQLPQVTVEDRAVVREDGIDVSDNIDLETATTDIGIEIDPNEIDLDDLLSDDDPSSPLSDLVVNERSES